MPKQDEKEQKQEGSSTKNTNFTSLNASHNWARILVGAIVVLVVFMVGFAAGNHHKDFYRTGGVLGRGYAVRHIDGGERGIMVSAGKQSMFGSGGILTDAQSKTHGVVTKVSGSNFTIAGNGATTSITISSSTQYHGGNTVKVNDTVGVIGTLSGNTIKATQIIINP